MSIAALARYRRALVHFVRALPMWLDDQRPDERTGAGLARSRDPANRLCPLAGRRCDRSRAGAHEVVPAHPWRCAVAVPARRRGDDHVAWPRRPPSPGLLQVQNVVDLISSQQADRRPASGAAALRAHRRRSSSSAPTTAPASRSRRQHGHDDARAAQRRAPRRSTCCRSRGTFRSSSPAAPTSSTPPTREGGTPLLIKTLKTEVFPGLAVNHVVDINFGGFEKLVDAIGCVYGDVDHRYYNNTALTDYSSIDIQPGYRSSAMTERARVRALPPHRQRHRPQRPPAGLHPLGEGRLQHRSAVQRTATSCCGSSASTRRPTPACRASTG